MERLLDRTGIKEINFFSIDVEGCELEVVLTHDWKKIPVQTVIVETRPQEIEKNRLLSNALHHAGMCRFAEEVGHHNEVWINTEWMTTFIQNQ